MSKPATPGEIRPLLLLHALAMFGLAGGWVAYCWRETSLLVRLRRPIAGDFLGLDRALDLGSAALGDIFLGLCAVLVLAIGTGLYVRRAQVWIDARSSGEAVAYGSVDLKDSALAANADETRRA
jgi:hypothetical protein